MKIIYSSSAKEDLSKIDWRDRQAIISHMEKIVGNDKLPGVFENVFESSFKKLKIANYIVIGEEEKTKFKVINVFEKQRIRLPE